MSLKIIEGQVTMLDLMFSDVTEEGRVDNSNSLFNAVDLRVKDVILDCEPKESIQCVESCAVEEPIADVYSVEDNDKGYCIDGIVFTKDVFNNNIQLPFINAAVIETISDGFKAIIEEYKESCSRIVMRTSGALFVELDDKSLYYNSDAKFEMNLPTNLALLPGDKILIANKDKSITDKQIEILNGYDVTQCIKRVGDANIILVKNRTIVINPKGWVIDYVQSPSYNDSMVYTLSPDKCDSVDILEDVSENLVASDEEVSFLKGDIVCFSYKGKEYEGAVFSVYNNGETINVLWNNQVAPFYCKNLIKK